MRACSSEDATAAFCNLVMVSALLVAKTGPLKLVKKFVGIKGNGCHGFTTLDMCRKFNTAKRYGKGTPLKEL